MKKAPISEGFKCLSSLFQGANPCTKGYYVTGPGPRSRASVGSYKSKIQNKMKKAIIIIIWAIFLTICLVNSAHGQDVNSKPEARPDTFTTKAIDVLKNDYDMNNDSMKVAWFNGKAFTGKVTLTKKDTGTFEITDKGGFYFTPDDRFYGQVQVNYHVNDLKSGGPGRVKGKGVITCIIKPVIQGPSIDMSKCEFRVICSRAGCIYVPAGKYTFDLVLYGDTIKDAHAYFEKAYQQPDTVQLSQGLSKKVVLVYEYYYISFYWPKTQKLECMQIPEGLYNYIRLNSCRR